ncbi:rhodanese-like domain-containing protein [Caproiciproducens sp. R2]|jgi:rhodanese-related sulfurtransferase|uniref:rhodanese-like domain-containing protein n=1 Tax=Caproiciproducens sp. R2 TaxID=3435187 RepID=UPI004033B77E
MFKTLLRTKTYDTVSPKEAKKRLEENPDLLLLDVRTPEEYREIRIPGSRLIPLNELEQGIKKAVPDKSREILVYCLSGARAAAACRRLSAMGYTRVGNMGGIRSWPYQTVSGR